MTPRHLLGVLLMLRLAYTPPIFNHVDVDVGLCNVTHRSLQLEVATALARVLVVDANFQIRRLSQVFLRLTELLNLRSDWLVHALRRQNWWYTNDLLGDLQTFVEATASTSQ